MPRSVQGVFRNGKVDLTEPAPEWAAGKVIVTVAMVKSVHGLFRDGEVKLTEPAPEGAAGKVIVTFLSETSEVDLTEVGIDREQAADLRRRLSAFSEDWDRPEMDVYDAP